MTNLDREVLSIYEEISRLNTPEKQLRALTSWWQYLRETCSAEHPCIECLRERQAGL